GGPRPPPASSRSGSPRDRRRWRRRRRVGSRARFPSRDDAAWPAQELAAAVGAAVSALLGAHLAERALEGTDARAIRVGRQRRAPAFALGSHLERHGYTLVDEVELDRLRKGTDRLAAAQQLGDRLAAFVSVVLRQVVDVHLDEPVGDGLVDT